MKESLDSAQGTQLMNILSAAARDLAASVIHRAVDRGGDPNKITEAGRALAEGDALRASGKFQNAFNKYKDALSKAEGAGWRS